MGQIDYRLVRVLVDQEIACILFAAARSRGVLDVVPQAHALKMQFSNSGLSVEEIVGRITIAAEIAGVAVFTRPADVCLETASAVRVVPLNQRRTPAPSDR